MKLNKKHKMAYR